MGYITKITCEEAYASKKKLVTCLILGVLFLSFAIFTLVVNPLLLIVSYCARADYGTAMDEALSQETDSIHVSAYLFNITNAEQFLSGEDEKLKVEEVGPFTYQENRTNEDLQFDTVAGVMRYTPRHRVTFIPEESVGDPQQMIVTMPNVALLAMASAVTEYGYIAKMGLNVLAGQLGSNATVVMSAHDYLWGYEEPLIKVGNRVLPGWISFDKLGLLDRMYDGSATKRLEVSGRDADKFMIRSANGLGGLEMWGYEDVDKRSRCNSFNNTFEGIGYPPQLTPDRPIRLYRNVLCRILDLEYQGNKRMDFGIEGLNYKISNKSYTKIPENQCLCDKGICHEGVSDLSPCFYGLPVVLSNAHFLDADPSIYDRVEGMYPNEEEHGSEIIIEPIIGMVMRTKFSVQVSVMVNDVGFNSKVKSFSNMFVPVFYLKIIQPRMPDDRIASLRMVHIYSPYMLLGMQVVLILSGLLLLSHAVRLFYWNWYHSRRKMVTVYLETKELAEASKEPLMERRPNVIQRHLLDIA